MDSSQLTTVLLNAQKPDFNVRQLAEKWLMDFQAQNKPLFLAMLSRELANEEKPQETRTLAGLLIKNSLSSKDEAIRAQQIKSWTEIDPNVRTQIKTLILGSLNSPHPPARHTAAQVLASVAHVELPLHYWPELIGTLLNNMQQPSDPLKQSTLEALGYICGEIEPSILALQANEILTAVCKGIKDPNPEIKFAGCTALFNALEFVKGNFEKEVERNYIMAVICESASFTDSRVRVVSFECLAKVADLYYDKLAPYMQKIFNLTLHAIQKDDDQVAQQGVEFWSTVSEAEIEIAEETEDALENGEQPPRPSQFFIRGASKYLVPVLTEAMAKQDDEPDEDTWNVAMAAGTCLELVSQTTKDEVVQYVMPFVETHIKNPNWKYREAATLAFGAILQGPNDNLVKPLISSAIPVFMQHLKDPIPYVKDTTAWTLGRICELHFDAIGGHLPSLIAVLVETLADPSAKVAGHSCWAIHNLATEFMDDAEKDTSVLSPFFAGILEKLAQASVRDDCDEGNLRASAYEAINSVIAAGAKDTIPIVMQALPLFLSRFEQVLKQGGENVAELQSLLCATLQAITQKLGTGIKSHADQLMALYLQVFSSKAATVHEEALMAVGALANAVEGTFEKYMSHFKPYLILGLKNYEEHQVCSVAVGVLGDLSRALGQKLSPYCDEIITILLQDLQNPKLHRDVKPPILASFGDLALAIGADFVKYMPYVMTMLQQASATTVDQEDLDLVDYLNSLREDIFEAYTGIIQGLRTENAGNHLVPHLPHIVGFANFVFQDPSRTDAVIKGAIGVLGDLAHALGPQAKSHLKQPFVQSLISEGMKSKIQSVKDIATWARDLISAL